MADLTFQVAPIDDLASTARVAMSGAIDASTVINFQNKLEQLKGEGTRRFLLDMEGIRYVNSTGLGSLVKLADQLENEGGAIVLMKIHPKVKVVFDMLGLNAFFRIFNSDAEAVDHLESLPPVGGAPEPEPEPEPIPAPAPVAAPAPAPAPVRAPAPAPAPVAAAPVAAAPVAPAPVAAGPGTVSCGGCGSTLRVSTAGGYRCPRCLTPFLLEANGSTAALNDQGAAPIHLTLTGSAGCTAGLKSLVSAVAGDAGFSGSAAGEVESSVAAAVGTIVAQAYDNDASRVYSVFINPGQGQLSVTLADTGRSLDGSAFAGAQAGVDSLDVASHPRGGNVVTLRKQA